MIEEARLWHVTVTVSGEAVEQLLVRAALQRLTQQRPFISSVGFNSTTAVISYWDEADTLVDAASLALRMWNEYRTSARLPAWDVVALEVTERAHRVTPEAGSDLVELNLQTQPH